MYRWLLVSALLPLLACGPTAVPRFKGGTPEVQDAPKNLPLTPTLVVRLNQPATLDVALSDSRGERVLRFDAEERVHRIPLLGLRPRDRATLVVTAHGAGGSADSRPVEFEVGRLPDRFPDVEVLALDPALQEPGLLLLPIELVSDSEEVPYLLALDADREVVWVWETRQEHGDVRMHPSGSIYALGSSVAWELSPAGEVLGQWGAKRERPASPSAFTEVPVGDMHHELFPLPGADRFWTLSSSPEQVPAYPCSYVAPTVDCGPGQVKSTRVVQFTRDGEVLLDRPLTGLLDSFRIGYDALDGFANGSKDWSHGNAVIARPEGGVLVSVRHQDALVALDEDLEIEWILGDPAGWEEGFLGALLRPVGEAFDWPYHAHGPVYAADGTLWMFDNHNHGTTPYSGPSRADVRSRVVGYAVDAENRSVRQVAAFSETATGPVFSRALGNAAVMPTTGNLLGVYGMPTDQDGVSHRDLGLGSRAVRLVEWTREGALASDVRLQSDEKEEAQGWRTYRAVPAASLYPDGVESWEPSGR